MAAQNNWYNPNKYAQIEQERRFLLGGFPPGFNFEASFARVIDGYITGTRLRLRRIESPSGETMALKLGQKFRAPGQEPHQAMMTTIYINDAEYELLAELPQSRLVKRRYPYVSDDVHFSLDVFEGHLSGLVLLEAEFASNAKDTELIIPKFAVREVTAEPFFTGGALANLSSGDFRRWLSMAFGR